MQQSVSQQTQSHADMSTLHASQEAPVSATRHLLSVVSAEAHVAVQQLQALGDTVGVVSRGAAHNIMESLHQTAYAQHKPEHSQEDATEQ